MVPWKLQINCWYFATFDLFQLPVILVMLLSVLMVHVLLKMPCATDSLNDTITLNYFVTFFFSAACDPGYAPICADGTCVTEDALCDGFFECPDYTDEILCPRKLFNKSNKISYISIICDLSFYISFIYQWPLYNEKSIFWIISTSLEITSMFITCKFMTPTT